MKNYITYILLLVLIAINSNAQIGIGTTTPRGALDINSSNAGLITPQIPLTSILDNTTVVNLQTNGSPVNGTLIWNTATAGTTPNNVVPGYYYWESNKWIRLNSLQTKSSNIGSSVIDNNNKTITCSNLNQVAYNITEITLTNAQTIDINLPVNNLAGTICNITASIDIYMYSGVNNQLDLYLISPDGKILELSTDNGGTSSGNVFSVTFTDSATQNITAWTTASAYGEYKPEGTLNNSNNITPTIRTLAGFHNINPNGIWKLRLIKDTSGNSFTFKSVTLNIATIDNKNYKLVAEKEINSLVNKNIIASSTYSVNTPSDMVQTIITRSANSQSNYSPHTTLPANAERISVITQNKENSLNWINNYNQAVDETLTNNTTYYYQLWVLGAPATTTSDTEQYNFIVRTDDKPTN